MLMLTTEIESGYGLINKIWVRTVLALRKPADYLSRML